MQQMIEGKGIAPHFQKDFGSLIEQLLLCMTHNIGDYVKNVVREAIEEINHPLASSKEVEIEDGFLTRAEALKFLKISSPTLHRYQKAGLLPYHKVGRKIYFKKIDLVDATKVSSKKRGVLS
jgi:hypothetical protein